MKKEYTAASPIAGTELMLIGGGMGNTTRMDKPLSIMAMPDGLTEAVRDAQEKILAKIAVDQKHAKKLGKILTPLSIVYACEVVSRIESATINTAGAFIELTATVHYV